MHIAIIWPLGGVCNYAPSVDWAREEIQRQLPTAHFGSWEPIKTGGRNLPVWNSAGDELRWRMGERDQSTVPVAYIAETPKRIAKFRYRSDKLAVAGSMEERLDG